MPFNVAHTFLSCLLAKWQQNVVVANHIILKKT